LRAACSLRSSYPLPSRPFAANTAAFFSFRDAVKGAIEGTVGCPDVVGDMSSREDGSGRAEAG
jgi:hypothetical protein